MICNPDQITKEHKYPQIKSSTPIWTEYAASSTGYQSESVISKDDVFKKRTVSDLDRQSASFDPETDAILMRNKREFVEDYLTYDVPMAKGELDDVRINEVLEEHCSKLPRYRERMDSIREYVKLNSSLHFAMNEQDTHLLQILLDHNTDLSQKGFNDDFPFEATTDDCLKNMYPWLSKYFLKKIKAKNDKVSDYVWKVDICFTYHKDLRKDIVVLAHVSRKAGALANVSGCRMNNVEVKYVLFDEVSVEGQTVLCHEVRELGLSIRNISVKNTDAKGLFSKHSNLNAIRPSILRSTKFGTPHHNIYRQTCIVLYCRRKGCVPINESIFPKEIDGIPTDVREGYYMPGTGEIRQGDEIYRRSKCGTLGGFVELSNLSLGFITCAHVLYEQQELQTLMKSKDSKNFRVPIHTSSQTGDSSSIIGNVVEASFFTNDPNCETSVDAAVVEIEERKRRQINISYPEIFDLKGILKQILRA